MKVVRLFFLIALLVSSKFVLGQFQDTLTYPYKITGIIRDENGNPVPGANIVSPGDGNMQVSDAVGKYFAYIYSPKTPAIFSSYKFSSVQFCPDGRTYVDIVLIRQTGLKSKRKKKESYKCP